MAALGLEVVEIEIEGAGHITAAHVAEAHSRRPLKGVLFARPANPTGAVIRNVFVNGIQLIQNTTTPGSGDEPGFAFTVAPNGTISQ
jgi:aspartate/methionine/tyrosine aminotransferase